MKKLAILATAFVLAASAANAESVTINHETAGGLLSEIESCGIEKAAITEIKIIGEAALTSADFKNFREDATLKAGLKKFDISEAVLATANKLPGGQWDGGSSFVGGMTGLEEVVLPETLNSLGGAPFLDCTNLKKVNLTANVKTYPSKCFQGCKNLTYIGFTEIPDGVTTIESGAFRDCALLELGGEMPASISKIGGHAFCDAKKVSFTKLPARLTNANNSFGENAFQRTAVTFSEIPTSITALPKQVFAGSNVSFSKIPDHITSVGAMVFQSCLKIGAVQPFTIDDRFNLWKEIPQGFFFVSTAVTRTFICRAPSAPKVSYVTGGGWDECFGKPEHCVNTTMKVLASALESYQKVAPYNKMHLEVLKTAVAEPVVEMPVGHDAANVSVKFVVNDVEHDSFGEVLEGEGKFVVSFGDAAHEWLHVQEISYVAPEVYAEGEDAGDTSDETDPNVLYRVGNVSQSLKKTIEVPVTVTPDMKPLRVVVAMADVITGVDEVAVPEAVVTRNGDIVNLTVPGAVLYDLAGRLVISTDTNTLDLGSVPAGVYVLRAGKKAVKIVK